MFQTRHLARSQAIMAPKAGTKISREEELLLEGFNKNVSTKSSALFYGNAFIVSVIPVWLYWRVHSIDVASYAIMFAIGTLVSTWLLAFAYKNTKHVLKHKVAVKREAAVTKEIMKKLADDKKISKKEKDERILWKKNEVSRDLEIPLLKCFVSAFI
jgi:translocon-associated protein subunit gamma